MKAENLMLLKKKKVWFESLWLCHILKLLFWKCDVGLGNTKANPPHPPNIHVTSNPEF